MNENTQTKVVGAFFAAVAIGTIWWVLSNSETEKKKV